MPYQNRVDPFGEIRALPERGAWTGNRGGCLHDAAGRLGGARWKSRAWLICRLQYKGWRRRVMAPRLYTHLFFLDEATALAAGHRPCALCRRADYDRFRTCVAPEYGGARPSAVELDLRLHADRLDGHRQRRTRARLGDLPDGAMVVPPDSGEAWLLWQGALQHWTAGGYDRRLAVAPTLAVAVLTPAITLAALARGYQAQIAPPVP